MVSVYASGSFCHQYLRSDWTKRRSRLRYRWLSTHSLLNIFKKSLWYFIIWAVSVNDLCQVWWTRPWWPSWVTWSTSVTPLSMAASMLSLMWRCVWALLSVTYTNVYYTKIFGFNYYHFTWLCTSSLLQYKRGFVLLAAFTGSCFNFICVRCVFFLFLNMMENVVLISDKDKQALLIQLIWVGRESLISPDVVIKFSPPCFRTFHRGCSGPGSGFSFSYGVYRGDQHPLRSTLLPAT